MQGLVQGVGFRPFIFRLATRYGLHGEVDNRTDGVTIVIECDFATAERFVDEIIMYSPRASQIKSLHVRRTPFIGYSNFSISASRDTDDIVTEVSPDIAVCSECLEDMVTDPARENYPLVNCTHCGPRFTIIKSLPYDRSNTTMQSFGMCEKCNTEYNDIWYRRFHAQPVACNNCGPQFSLTDGRRTITSIKEILNVTAMIIADGGCVAVKGTGGYFLMCDALNNEAVMSMRRRKQREARPFAVMFRDIETVRLYCHTGEHEERELSSWRRPVVILEQKEKLAEAVSSGLNTTGALLPYMPLHYLLFRHLSVPAVVFTSGNISDEPIIADDKQAVKELLSVAEAVLSYNRDIHNRCDDSVVRIIDKQVVKYRRSRGYVPAPVDLGFSVEGVLATGAEQKNCFCIGKGSQAIISQHIGDLKNLAAYEFFRESVGRFSDLFRFSPAFIACDMHPSYFSSVFAGEMGKKLDVPVMRVQHHHAHIASCMAEHNIGDRVIGVSFDGTGYGTDGNTWGSEFFIADMSDYERYAHLDYFMMPGGDRVTQEPWRMALSCLCRYSDGDIHYGDMPCFSSVPEEKFNIVKNMISEGVNVPLSCGAGRLFDAVAALTGLCTFSSYDAEAPMRLESAIGTLHDHYYPFTVEKTIALKGLFDGILNDLKNKDPQYVSVKFHNTLAEIISGVARTIKKETGLNRVVLSGGVFQNKYLLEKTLFLLEDARFRVYTNSVVPPNDGGISLGQMAVAAKKLKICV